MRPQVLVLVPALLTAAAAGVRAQDPIEAVEKQLRERVALRLAANDLKGAFALAERSADDAGLHEKFAGTLLLAELHFSGERREEALRVTTAWREQWNPQVPAGALGPGDLIEVLDPRHHILERGIVGADGSLWHFGDRRVPKIVLQRPEKLDPATREALRAHYGEGVELRAWRTEKQVFGVPPQENAPQESERVKQVRDLLAKTNLPRQSEKEAAQLDALRRLGPAAMEAAEQLWMSAEERPPVRVNAAYLIATEYSTRLAALLPDLKQERFSSAADVLLQAMEMGGGVPPHLASSELRALWLGLLDSPSSDVRYRALSLYNAAFPVEIEASLAQLAGDPDQRVRQLVAQMVLPRLAWNDAVLAVAQTLLRDRDATVREHAVRLLGERNQLRAHDALLILREDSNAGVRGQVLRQAARAPGVLQGTVEELEGLLLQGLHDPNASNQSLAVSALDHGNVNPIRSRVLAVELLQRATSSDQRMRSSACMAMQFLDAPLLGPIAEEMLQRVPQQNWIESQILAKWRQRDNASSLFAKTELRPAIWLERREWMQADSNLASAYDEFLRRFVIPRLTAEDLPRWLSLLEARELGDSIIGRAIAVDARLLEPALRDQALPRAWQEYILKSLAQSKNSWLPELILGRPDLQRASVVRLLTAFSDRPEVQRFLSEWLLRDAPPDEKELSEWRETMTALIGTFDPRKKPTEDQRPWLIPVAVKQLAQGDAAVGQLARLFLARQNADACLDELEKQLALFVEPRQVEVLNQIVLAHAEHSGRAARFWVQHIAPLVEREARLQDGGVRPLPSLAARVSELRDLYVRWERAESAVLRKWAAEFYRKGPVPDALDRLLRMIEDPNEDVRARAAHSLRAFADPRAVDALIAAQSDATESVREAADGSLKLLRVALEEKRFWSTFRADGGEDPLAKIVPLLRDPDAEVRALAIDSLGALGSPRALPHLLELFKAGKDPEKSAARRAIERIQKAVDAERAKGGEPPAPAPDKGGEAEKKKEETAAGGRDR